MKLILVRHGETVENRRNILQGQTPGKLTVEGIFQVNKYQDETILVIQNERLAKVLLEIKEELLPAKKNDRLQDE